MLEESLTSERLLIAFKFNLFFLGDTFNFSVFTVYCCSVSLSIIYFKVSANITQLLQKPRWKI